MSTTSPVTESNPPANRARKRGCLSIIGRGLKWFVILLVALVLLGVVYQAVAAELDKRNYPPPGQLYTVNGHQMHLVCKGQGSPTVILQAGGVADSLWWYWVQNQVAEGHRVCAYDRPGMGWSEPAAGSRDALTIAEELHTLLQEADVPGPYIMAGHSHGATLTRIYAKQYPDDIAGIVLVDSSVLIPDHFADQAEFEKWKAQWSGLKPLVDIMTRIGLSRLLAPGTFQAYGYPADVAAELGALQSRNQVFDTDFAEFVTANDKLTEAASAAYDLGDLPMTVLWARDSLDAFDSRIEGFAAGREKIANASSNSTVQVIDGATHGSILGNEGHAQQVSDAILKMIQNMNID